MVVDVHVLGYPKPVLSLNVTEYDKGSAATAELKRESGSYGRRPGTDWQVGRTCLSDKQHIHHVGSQLR